MRALFYSPYLDTLGGGEKYMLTLVEALNNRGWETYLSWDEDLKKKAKDKFDLDIKQTHLLPNVFNKISGVEKYSFLKQFNLVFFLSDGSFPFLWGEKNILHLQTPFHGVGGNSFINQIKKIQINKVIVNSKFTKQVIDKEYALDSTVIYPPVEVSKLEPHKKVNAILYVARFSNLQQQKGHEIAIRAFQALTDSGVKNYELWLSGSTEVGADELLKQLKIKAKGYKVKFFTDIKWQEMKSLYEKAKFFWSAVGYGINEDLAPEKCEHFGIALVEAMAGGCIPLTVYKGGYKEIIEDNHNGFFWYDVNDLVAKTRRLISNKTLTSLEHSAVRTAKKFSKENFVEKFIEVINKN